MQATALAGLALLMFEGIAAVAVVVMKEVKLLKQQQQQHPRQQA